jgi:hypothetical protein
MPFGLWVFDPPPTPRNRLTCAIRIIWALPQLLALLVVNFVAFFAIIAAWFVALVTGRVGPGLREFIVGILRWDMRVEGYLYFLTDAYPPYSIEEVESYPIRLGIPPEQELNRLAVLFRIFIAIPAWIVASVLGSGLFIVSIGSWFMLLVTGELPRPLFEATRIVIRYQARFYAYLGLLTPEYAWGPIGDTPEVAAQDPWAIQLSDTGRTATMVVIVIGVIVELVNSAVRPR